MKRFISCILGTAILCAVANLTAHADQLLPGQVDFGSFSPPKGGGQFVEVNVPTVLINLASQIVAKDDPDVAKLLDGLKLVKVNVIGLDDENRPELEKRAQKLRQDLSAGGWVRVVTVQEKDQDVSVYLKLDDKGAVQGLTAVVIDGKDDAVFANVVGNIKPEQLAMIGEKFNIKPLEKLKISTDKHENQHQDNNDADEKPKEKSAQ
ncbi:MAG TPA: DUF4252 domain-containing protein [Candidatus Baltobacteraceae bacterium]|jgi:hypothetical protein|nr:DUF4252 domain-containing protein [Candidatus Baltobacteraceae bacterium]